MTAIDLVVCGVGAGATYVYDGEFSSTFLLRVDGRPVLLLDCGVGAVRSVSTHVGRLPDHIYISHNHTDHAGDLPVMLAIEAQKGHRMTLLAETTVLNTLLAHRLHELQSTGRQLSDFGDFHQLQAGQLHQLPGGLALLPLQSRHAERCYGLLVYHHRQPVLGWSADSGYDAALYTALSAAPVLLLDGRARGTSEHAGFSQLAAAASSGLFGGSRVYVYGYGVLGDAPRPEVYPNLCAVVPGSVLPLAPVSQAAAAAVAPAEPAASVITAHMVAAAAASAAAEATAAASAAAAVTAAGLAAVAAAARQGDSALQDLPALGALGCDAGWPGVLLQQKEPGSRQQSELREQQQPLQIERQRLGWQHSDNKALCRCNHNQVTRGVAGPMQTLLRQQHLGVSSTNSTSSSTAI